MEQLPVYDDNDANSINQESDSKRRKLRKGTRSCWDCKRRKVKCSFESATDSVCIPCRRRGALCVSQERPEEEFQTEDSRGQLFERLLKVESLLEELVNKVGHSVRDVNSDGLRPSGNPKPGVLTPYTDTPSRDCQAPSVSAIRF